ncbi:MAG TPA: hypothetical protein PLO37_19430 [Candidatus Hydrogenedentes bacterium]|nr:hypothetical protein [Candidatus Hydrogenedentota bacterium]HPG69025.1 hypothetical protein [Candidatus Hydrogenedentota bacterium]
MKEPAEEADRPSSLGAYVVKALRERKEWRPSSFYFLLCVPIVMIAAVPAFYMHEDPRKFALHLSLVFVFLLVIVWRAVMDLFEISRRHRKERREAFEQTLGGGLLKQAAPRDDRPTNGEE